MPELLFLTNFPEVNLVERTLLTADIAAAVTSTVVQNVQNFAVDDVVVFGPVATEQAEKRTLTTVTAASQTLGFAATAFAHKKLEPVTKLRANQIKVYRAANATDEQPDDDDFVHITTVDIDVAKSYTEYNDPDGGVGYWYKATYYHSIAQTETDIAESPAVRGGNYGHYATVEQVRIAAGFTGNSDIIDEVIAEARDEAEGMIKGYVIAAGYFLPLLPPYPASVARLVKQLASAFLLQGEYGVAAQGSNRDGYAMEEAVMKKLNAIQEGTFKLVDVHLETVTPQKDEVSGLGDESGSIGDSGRRGPIFTIAKKW